MLDVLPQLGMSPVWLVVLLVAVCAVEATLVLGSLVPGEIVVVLAVGVVDVRLLPLLIVAAAIGSFVGQAVGFLLGRWTGDWLKRSALGRRLGDRRWHRGELLMRNATVVTMIAVRFVAVVHTIAPVAAGALRLPTRRFFGLAMISSAVWSLVWVAVGVIAGVTGDSVDSPLLATVLAVLGVIVAGLALPRMTRRLGTEPEARTEPRLTVLPSATPDSATDADPAGTAPVDGRSTALPPELAA